MSVSLFAPSIDSSKLRRLALLFMVIAASVVQVGAAVTEAWVHRYSNALTNPVDRAFGVTRDVRDDLIVNGVSFDGIAWHRPLSLLLKFSGKDGTLLWEHRRKSPEDGDDYTTGIAVDGSGNVIIYGDVSSNRGVEYYTAKYGGATGELVWERKEGGPLRQPSVKLAADGVGDVFVTKAPWRTIKYASSDGRQLWEQRSERCTARAMALDAHGNVLVAGSFTNETRQGYYTAKYAGSTGVLMWEQYHVAPGGGGFTSATDIAVDPEGNVLVTGEAAISDGTEKEVYTVKYAGRDGSMLWELRHPLINVGYPTGTTSLDVDRNGDVVVTSRLGSVYHSLKYRGTDGSLLFELNTDYRWGRETELDPSGNLFLPGRNLEKFSAQDGSLIWSVPESRTTNGVTEFHWATADSVGNVIATSTLLEWRGRNEDIHLAKYAAADGRLLWKTRYNYPGPRSSYHGATAVVVDSDGDVAVTGTSEGQNSLDVYTAKYAGLSGRLLWEKRYRDPAGDFHSGGSIAVDSQNHLLVAWTSRAFGVLPSLDSYTPHTAKYRGSDGVLIWEQRDSSPNYISVNAVAVDQRDDVVVSGTASGGYYTAKYASTDGALLWENSYRTRTERSAEARAMALDPAGDVVVTGVSPTLRPAEAYTVKYAGSDGSLLWERRDTRSPAGNLIPTHLAIDQHGNVVITGRLQNGTNESALTIKYASTNGAVLWETPRGVRGSKNSVGNAVAIDAEGNVVVTEATQQGSHTDYRTVKYAATNGSLLWEQSYNGPGNSDDRPTAIAIDPRGDVIVSGISSSDFHTIAYSGTDGAILWEQRYNGPANGDDWGDSLRGLALGPDGMVAITGSSAESSGGLGGSEYATVVYRVTQPSASLDLLSKGVRLRFSALPGENYHLQRAARVDGPWTPVTTSRASVGGLLEFVDGQDRQGAAFYRVVQAR